MACRATRFWGPPGLHPADEGWPRCWIRGTTTAGRDLPGRPTSPDALPAREWGGRGRRPAAGRRPWRPGPISKRGRRKGPRSARPCHGPDGQRQPIPGNGPRSAGQPVFFHALAGSSSTTPRTGRRKEGPADCPPLGGEAGTMPNMGGTSPRFYAAQPAAGARPAATDAAAGSRRGGSWAELASTLHVVPTGPGLRPASSRARPPWPGRTSTTCCGSCAAFKARTASDLDGDDGRWATPAPFQRRRDREPSCTSW